VRETGDLGNARIDVLRPITNALALGRQAVRARQPLDQADTQLLLEHVDAAGHRRVVDPELLRSAREAPGLGQREKEFEVVPVHSCLRTIAQSLRRSWRSV
jgi:hypothetical protein